MKPELQQVLEKLIQKNAEVYAEYDYVIRLIMELNGMTHEQAEDELMKQLLNAMPDFENYENMNTKIAGLNMHLTKIGKQLFTKREAIVGEQSWKEVQATLKESPALEKYNKDFVQMLIDYGKTVNGFDSNCKEVGAYETVLYLYSVYSNLDCSKWDMNYNAGYLKRMYNNVLDFMYRNK